MYKNITTEDVVNYLNGESDEKYITYISYDYRSNNIIKTIDDPDKGKRFVSEKLKPFCWLNMKKLLELNFYGNTSKSNLKTCLMEAGIIPNEKGVVSLETGGNEYLENGQSIMFKSSKTYSELISFFKKGGVNPWDEKFRDHVTILSPQEQYLIYNGKRLFKGMEEYDEVHRMVFDIETTGLDPEKNEIFLIGIKDNRGFERVLAANDDASEMRMIIDFFNIIKRLKPSILGGYNSSFFDFPFIIRRAEILGLYIDDLMPSLFKNAKYRKKKSFLKLGQEVEDIEQLIIPGINIIDIAHSVRRAQAINSNIKSWSLKYITKYLDLKLDNRVYIDGNKLSQIYFDEETEYYYNPKTGNYKELGSKGTENLLERFPNAYEVVKGKFLVEKYLYDDLYETMVVDEQFNQANFLVSKLIPSTYERVSTMGTAGLWKLLMLGWSYKHRLSIPAKKEKTKYTGGLSRLVRTGFAKDVLKLDYSSLYPSIQLVHNIFPDTDISHATKLMLKYFRDTRIKYKILSAKYKDSDIKLSEKYDRKQLPIKIFINSFFGSLSAPHIFNWGDIDKGEAITCTGRQYLRQMIMWFENKGYKTLVMDTDGVNFSAPEHIKTYKYIGKGLNELVEEGKEYIGADAHVAEYNDLFMRGEMGLDIDGVWPATINISRKNYALLTPQGKLKLTGNTIKSKTLPQYIEEFIDKGVRLLLEEKGSEFIDYYYEYVNKIYNKEIPLMKIANKSRVKMTTDEYIAYTKKKNKAGNNMARQAHMELVMKDNLNPGLGETIYYVNNGSRKSHGDVQKKKTGLVINAYRLENKDIEENPNMLGEYNVPRYLDTFNKRIKPLLVVFHPDIRDKIIVDNPENFSIFTKNQTELVNGYPVKEKDQDNLHDRVLIMSDSEVKYWNRLNKDPYYMYVEGTLDEVDLDIVEKNRNLLDVEN